MIPTYIIIEKVLQINSKTECCEIALIYSRVRAPEDEPNYVLLMVIHKHVHPCVSTQLTIKLP